MFQRLPSFKWGKVVYVHRPVFHMFYLLHRHASFPSRIAFNSKSSLYGELFLGKCLVLLLEESSWIILASLQPLMLWDSPHLDWWVLGPPLSIEVKIVFCSCLSFMYLVAGHCGVIVSHLLDIFLHTNEWCYPSAFQKSFLWWDWAIAWQKLIDMHRFHFFRDVLL